jgi:TonB family protein
MDRAFYIMKNLRNICLCTLLTLISLHLFAQKKDWSEGKTKKGEKAGVWIYYQYNGELYFSYDYDKKEVLEVGKIEREDTIDTAVLIDGDWKEVVLQRRPLYLEGQGEMVKYLSKTLRYPASASRDNTQGIVKVVFTIDSLGNTSDFQIAESLSEDCDKEAMRVIKSFPGKWIPALYDNKTVVSKYVFPLRFKLN